MSEEKTELLKEVKNSSNTENNDSKESRDNVEHEPKIKSESQAKTDPVIEDKADNNQSGGMSFIVWFFSSLPNLSLIYLIYDKFFKKSDNSNQNSKEQAKNPARDLSYYAKDKTSRNSNLPTTDTSLSVVSNASLATEPQENSIAGLNSEIEKNVKQTHNTIAYLISLSFTYIDQKKLKRRNEASVITKGVNLFSNDKTIFNKSALPLYSASELDDMSSEFLSLLTPISKPKIIQKQVPDNTLIGSMLCADRVSEIQNQNSTRSLFKNLFSNNPLSFLTEIHKNLMQVLRIHCQDKETIRSLQVFLHHELGYYIFYDKKDNISDKYITIKLRTNEHIITTLSSLSEAIASIHTAVCQEQDVSQETINLYYLDNSTNRFEQSSLKYILNSKGADYNFVSNRRDKINYIMNDSRQIILGRKVINNDYQKLLLAVDDNNNKFFFRQAIFFSKKNDNLFSIKNFKDITWDIVKNEDIWNSSKKNEISFFNSSLQTLFTFIVDKEDNNLVLSPAKKTHIINFSEISNECPSQLKNLAFIVDESAIKECDKEISTTPSGKNEISNIITSLFLEINNLNSKRINLINKLQLLEPGIIIDQYKNSLEEIIANNPIEFPMLETSIEY